MLNNLKSEKPDWVRVEKLPDPDDFSIYCPPFLEAYRDFEVFWDEEIWVANKEQTWKCEVQCMSEEEAIDIAREFIDKFWESPPVAEPTIIPGLESTRYQTARTQEGDTPSGTLRERAIQQLTLFNGNSTLTLFSYPEEEEKESIPSCRHPKEILPRVNWEQLTQDQLLGWALVAIESYRQDWSLWSTMLEYNLQDDLGFDDDELMLSKRELLFLATWTVHRAFKMVSGQL